MTSSHVSTPILHVGVFQGGCAEGVEANLKLLEIAVEQKRDQKVDLVIFAELFLCGYCIGPNFHEGTFNKSILKIKISRKRWKTVNNPYG